MGEYAVDQMLRDFRRATGLDAAREDFEYRPRPRPPKVRIPCRKCGRHFGSDQALADHQRDKHGISLSAPIS